MKVILCGATPLANELALRIEQAGHTLHAGDEAGSVREADLIVMADSPPVERYDAAPDTLLLCSVLEAPATEIAAWQQLPENTVGFAALPPLGGAIELVPARQSSAASIQRAETFWRSLQLDPVRVADGVAGVVPRVLCNLVNEAAHALQEGVASVEDIDRAMQLGTNWPRGPLAWGDLIGLPTVVGVIEALGREYGTDSYHPAPLLRQMARVGERFHRE